MLAISSDIDHTNMVRFRNLHRFLNTHEETPMGTGLGLDVADSLWVFVGKAPSDISLLKAYDRERPQAYADELTHYAQVGWIDALHTYGNYSEGYSSFERRHAELALAELKARSIYLPVWVNHGSKANIQNFGLGDPQEGDNPESPAYHTDMLLDYGVKFSWSHRDGVSLGHQDVIDPLALRDGRQLWGFPRFTQTVGPGAADAIAKHPDYYAHHPTARREWRGLPHTMLWWPALVDSQLSRANLDAVAARMEYSIVAQHLGDLDGADWLPTTAIDAFRRLRRYQDEGLILVARTSRLLEYSRVSANLVFDTSDADGRLYINITGIADPVLGPSSPDITQLRGITFHVPDPEAAQLLVSGAPLDESEVVRSITDSTGPTIGIKWFSPDTADYVAQHADAHGRRRVSPARYVPLPSLQLEELASTSEAIDLGELGVEHPLRYRYAPTHRNLAARVLHGIEIGGRDTFLDWGSGKGRMLLVAAAHPFKRVLGVEIAPQLSDVAWQNIEHNSQRLACSDIEIALADASVYAVPDDVTVVYFFNSFTGEFLRKALGELTASLARRPRRLTLIYMYPRDAHLVEATRHFAVTRTERFGDKPLDRIVYYRSST